MAGREATSVKVRPNGELAGRLWAGSYPMKVLICGGGAVGRAIAERLADERNSVTMVDLSSDVLARLSDELEVATVDGPRFSSRCSRSGRRRRLRHPLCRHAFR